MRRRNWRVIITGVALLAIALGFFLFAQADMAPKSNDPVEMMRTVGQVSGATGAISLVMIAFGLIGWKA